MRKIFFAALSIFVLPLSGHATSGISDGAQPTEPEWIWPLDNYGFGAIGHDYAEYNSCLRSCKHRTHLHKTGMDVTAPKGTPVKAVADGIVANLIPNDVGCKTNCTDHGAGNMIVLHNGAEYSNYQHLLPFNDSDPLISQIKSTCSFYDRIDENGVHVSGWECSKTDNVAVNQGDVVGFVGGTGYGRNKTYRPSLHFEATNFATLYSYACYTDSACCPQQKCFGYSGVHPFQVGFNDPVNLLHVTDGRVKVHVQVGPQGEGIGLHIGPDNQYDLQTRWHAADGTYWAIRSSAPSTDCDQGWYKIMKVKSFPPPIDEYFRPTDATRAGAGTLPDTWVCIGNGGAQYVIRAD